MNNIVCVQITIKDWKQRSSVHVQTVFCQLKKPFSIVITIIFLSSIIYYIQIWHIMVVIFSIFYLFALSVNVIQHSEISSVQPSSTYTLSHKHTFESLDQGENSGWMLPLSMFCLSHGQRSLKIQSIYQTVYPHGKLNLKWPHFLKTFQLRSIKHSHDMTRSSSER